MLLRARILLPVAASPIENGAVLISGNRIQRLGPWKDLKASRRGPVIDLGESILLPGLINAHAHLDYTGMGGQIPPPKNLTTWIQTLVALKGIWTQAEFARSWRRGAEMLARTGTTMLANIEAFPDLLPKLYHTTALRLLSFREIICLKDPKAARAAVAAAVADWDQLPAGAGRLGLSPHAPYSTTPRLLHLAQQAARKRRWRLTTHVAESHDEFELFMARRGPLHDWLHWQRDMADCGRGSPVQHLERCGYLSENLLAVHVNYLAPGDPELLGRRKVSVVHCPRSHAYFRHARFPYEELARARVNVCLGTDSLATTRPERGQPLELSLFAEMRAFAARRPGVAPEDILPLATVNGARALGWGNELGRLAPGALADLIAIPFRAQPAGVYDAVVHHRGPVIASMVDGKWALPPACAS